jgi:diguanylate cyclase
VSSSAIMLPPLLAFDEACRLVVAHLKREVPLAFWAVTRYEDDKQVGHCVQDDVYGQVAGYSLPWSETFCQFMVTGAAPQFAPDAMAVPQYAGTRAARELSIGTYVGVPIPGADGTLYGTICGIDPHRSSERLHEHEPLLRLFATLLGQILLSEHLRAEAADRAAAQAWSAFHDELTGLPNRAMFFDRVEHALDLHARDSRPVAVLLIDVDEFKAVNDVIGHASGDDLLVRAARRLAGALRPGDTLARLSGDEFAVLLEAAGDPAIVATRLLGALAAPFLVGPCAVAISASVGIAALSEDEQGIGVEAMLAHADIAVYTAKRAGKGSFAVYDPLMTLPGTRALQLREPLRQALLQGSVQAYFQPIVELTSGRITGFESLARWCHDGRYVEPDVFIPIAARSGLTPALTEHMLDLACAQLARWSAELGHCHLRAGVNVSPLSIGDPGLPDRVAQHMARHGIGPGQLVLEITEDALLHDLPTATAVTHRLCDLGVVLSLDDFGAGYSSLLHLRRIPLSSVKIDRGFAGDIDTNPETEHFMRALLAFGRDLDLRVIVEGVERPAQAEVLRRIGGTHAQGHLFGRPVPAELVQLDRVEPPPT